MLRLLFDQDFNHNILRGLFLCLPNLDGITALQAGLKEAPDPELLEWAAQHFAMDLLASRRKANLRLMFGEVNKKESVSLLSKLPFCFV